MRKAIEAKLTSYLKKKNEWITIKEIVEDCSICDHTARKYMKELLEQGKVEAKCGGMIQRKNKLYEEFKGWKFRMGY